VALDDPERSLLTRWVLRDPLKLLVHSDPQRPAELYEVRADPAEEHLLDDPEAVRALRADLDRWWPSRVGKQ
jgi:arylsulfatase A-like enzyme